LSLGIVTLSGSHAVHDAATFVRTILFGAASDSKIARSLIAKPVPLMRHAPDRS
jgi:hypothetical protein